MNDIPEEALEPGVHPWWVELMNPYSEEVDRRKTGQRHPDYKNVIKEQNLLKEIR